MTERYCQDGTRIHVPWRRRWRSVYNPLRTVNTGAVIEHGKTLIEWEHLPCLVLLGEPGSGKTEEVQTALTRSSEAKVVHLDLRLYGDETRLVSELRSELNSAMRDGDGQVILWLDALDEGIVHIRTLARLIPAEVNRLPGGLKERLSIRVVCRSGAWPKGLETALRTAFYEDGEPEEQWVLELLDLDESDLVEFIRHQSIPAEFAEAICRSGAEVFAHRPVTLWLLADLFAADSVLPASRLDLYEKAIERLIISVNTERLEARSLELPIAEVALDLCGVAAAAALFTGRSYLQLDHSGALSEAVRPADIFADQVKRQQLEVLVRHTPLFRRQQNDLYAFAHRTYAEYLAARLLRRRGVEESDLRSLMFSADGRVSPHLREFAGWAAALYPALLCGFVEDEPELILEGDPSLLSRSQQLRIVRRLFERIAAREVLVSGGETVQLLLRMPRERLVEAFGELFANPPSGEGRILYDALWVVRDAHLTELTSDVAAVVQDESIDPGDRRSASAVLISLSEDAATETLRRYLSPNQDGSAHPLYTRALSHLGSSELDADSFFSGTGAVHDDGVIGGEGFGFFAHDLPRIVERRGWWVYALRWIRSIADGRFGEKNWSYSLNSAVWDWLVRHSDDSELRVAFIELAADLGLRDRLFPENPERIDRPTRRLLIQEASSHPDVDTAEKAVDVLRWMVDGEDLEWLLVKHQTASSDELRARYRDLLGSVVKLDNRAHVEAVWLASDRDDHLQVGLPWFFGTVPLDSGYAQMQRRQRREQLRRAEAAARLGDPRVRVLRALEAAESEPSHWPGVMREMTLEEGMVQYGEWRTHTLDHLPGWKHADLDTKERLCEVALSYVESVRPPQELNWLTESTLPGVALDGLVSIFSLQQLAPHLLARISDEAWRVWVPSLLRLHDLVRGNSESFDTVVNHLPASAISEVARIVEYLALHSKEDLSTKVLLGTIRRYPRLLTAGMAHSLYVLVGEGRVSRHAEAPCLSLLLELDEQKAIEAASMLLGRRPSSRNAIRTIVSAGDANAWFKAMSALRGDKEATLEVVGPLADRITTRASQGEQHSAWPNNLPSPLIVELYRLLTEQFPPQPSDVPVSGAFIGNRHHVVDLRDSLPMILAERAGAEECEALDILQADLAASGIDLHYLLLADAVHPQAA